MSNLFMVHCLLTLCMPIFVCCSKTTTIDCKTFKNKHIQLEVTDVRESLNTTQLNLVNITSKYNYVLVDYQMPILCRKFLKKLSNVEYLWIPDAGLKEIEQKSFTDMKILSSLNIFNNNITILRSKTFINLKQLRFISLINNSITTIEDKAFENLISLEELNLSSNKITDVAKNWLISCRNLRKLNLRRNKLRTISFLDNLNTFQWLSLSFASNFITTIESDTFKKFFYIEELNLRNNSIKELPTDFLHSLKQGKALDVNENQLSCISRDIISKFTLVFMNDNPLTDICQKRLSKISKHYRMTIF